VSHRLTAMCGAKGAPWSPLWPNHYIAYRSARLDQSLTKPTVKEQNPPSKDRSSSVPISDQTREITITYEPLS